MSVGYKFGQVRHTGGLAADAHHVRFGSDMPERSQLAHEMWLLDFDFGPIHWSGASLCS